MKKTRNLFYFITIVTFICLYLNIPTDIKFKKTIIKKPTIQIPLGKTSFVRDLNFKKGLDLQGGIRVTLKADMDKIEEGKRSTALESVRAVISRRVDLYGVSESIVKTSVIGSEYRLVVELPGVKNPQEALDLVGQTANLVFAIPVYETDKASPSAQPLPKNFIPSNLTGSDLESAAITFETQDRSPAVAIKFKESGRDKFAKITKEFLQKPVAIMLDQEIISAPIVQSEIVSGDAVISGRFTIDEAKFLATQLNAGALPVPISVLSQQNISATLGESSIRQSIIAGGIGLGIVVIFMSLYYGFPGVIASISLLIYGLITATLYKLIPVTLTLPGVAGFILSVGMAVDSNILIFERLKEELRVGRSFAVALELAFGRAWDSIKDANIATIITGLILFNPLDWPFLNTSGAVRGFALTLLIGIFISLFTGVVVTRTLLRLFYHGPRNPQTMSAKGRSVFGGNWMKFRYLYLGISALIIIPGLISLLAFGLKLSIDFTGGYVLKLEGLSGGGTKVISQTKTISQAEADTIVTELKKDNPEVKIASFETIGPTLGKETIKKTAYAIILASLLLLLHIGRAFKQIKFGVCAVLAMLHDSLILLGIFSLLGHLFSVETDLLFVTAMLTVLSFSVHDTIVVYDRIRELKRHQPTLPVVDLANKAVSETMIRSLNNSLTIIFMLLALFLLGGETTKFFALALLVGTISGTYSSPFTAVPLLVIWDDLSRRKH